ncbi:TRAP transporter small permease [Falsihalocynthiibacter sp. SS001]|uniref:TRAP transporter small permease n=1 Tax=Falsihalocynthiibacter sp. SS001 TaxID=3349698 RepID=UPI0036D20C91
MANSFNKSVAQGLEWLALACAALAAVGMTAIVGIIVTSVMMRKFANSPVHITEEVVGLLLSVSLFLGLPMVTLKSKHVSVALITNQLSGAALATIRALGLLIAIAFFGWLIWESIPWLEFAFKRNLKTETTRILLYPWMALMPLSLGLTGIILVAQLLGIVTPPQENELELPQSDGAP